MVILPVDVNLAFYIIALCASVELLRIFFAIVFTRPDPNIKLCRDEKKIATDELAEIKSVQLELVKHSLLTRKVIKLDKQIEKLQSEFSPKIKKVKSIGRIARVSVVMTFTNYIVSLTLHIFHFIFSFSLSM